ncbi:PREDICTED: uncharacterized protein LOC108556119 [Eufriesea mexicana]|uniref:uncharacterized protein LOC108556119 n=1 Tax=Eufriesea mexicana TaxID=516756 RepID=UPI00083BEE4B|nr:PREDICTED: uncharacterized protein LOC108556119 [Eufriesea mexicana]
MSNIEDFMTDIYNTLVQIRYPKITTAVAKDVELTILNGENRLSLLSWLLAEQSPSLATKLKKLKGTALEVELLKSYSEIGICSDKKLLLGDCPLEEQLSTLRLLLDFIKCVFIESFDTDYNEKESIDNILNVYINEDPNTFACTIEPKLNYSESIQYFDNLQKYLNEYEELSSTCKSEGEEYLTEYISEETQKQSNLVEQDLLFNEEKKKFIEEFSSIESWSTFNAENMKNNLYSMDADISNIYSNFSSLTQFLQAKEEISNANIPKEINKLNTPLNEIVENSVTHTEGTRNFYMDIY